MKRLMSVGLSLVAVSAMGAVAAASAFAEAPEFGRCQAVGGEQMGHKTVYHGHYTNSVCTKASPESKGKYEWSPGVVKSHFMATSKPGTKVLFETADGKKIACTGETSTGEYTTPKLEENVVFKFTGCNYEERRGYYASERYPASSEGAAEGEILTEPTECELGVAAKGATAAKDKLVLNCAEEEEFMWLKWQVPNYTGHSVGIRTVHEGLVVLHDQGELDVRVADDAENDAVQRHTEDRKIRRRAA